MNGSGNTVSVVLPDYFLLAALDDNKNPGLSNPGLLYVRLLFKQD
ncbi:MAG: hypothetical protein ACI351_02300 [Candidatus Avelusimicrobium sp.]